MQISPCNKNKTQQEGRGGNKTSHKMAHSVFYTQIKPDPNPS